MGGEHGYYEIAVSDDSSITVVLNKAFVLQSVLFFFTRRILVISGITPSTHRH